MVESCRIHKNAHEVFAFHTFPNSEVDAVRELRREIPSAPVYAVLWERVNTATVEDGQHNDIL